MNDKGKNVGRKAPKMSIPEFKIIISQKLNLNPNDFDEYKILKYMLHGDDSTFNPTKASRHKFLKDISKIDFGTENWDAKSVDITNSGIPYIAGKVGGDWESPIGLYVYYDGKDIRGYIPYKGNPINLIAKSAFGNHEIEYGDKYTQEEYDSSDFKYIMSDYYKCDPELPQRLILNEENEEKYRKIRDDSSWLDIIWDACLRDFESRLEVI